MRACLTTGPTPRGFAAWPFQRIRRKCLKIFNLRRDLGGRGCVDAASGRVGREAATRMSGVQGRSPGGGVTAGRYTRPTILAWTDAEVMRQACKIFPWKFQQLGVADGDPTREQLRQQLRQLTADAELVAEMRTRLSDPSWFMRQLKHSLAVASNAEDGRRCQAPRRAPLIFSCHEALVVLLLRDENV